MRLFPDLREKEQRVEKLVRMGTTDEKDGAILGDVECAARSGGCASAILLSQLQSLAHPPDLSKEDVDDQSPEEQEQIVWKNVVNRETGGRRVGRSWDATHRLSRLP